MPRQRDDGWSGKAERENVGGLSFFGPLREAAEMSMVDQGEDPCEDDLDDSPENEEGQGAN